MKGANNTYFGSIVEAYKTTVTGAKITLRHFIDAILKKKRLPIMPETTSYFGQQEGIVTLSYPNESLPVPDNGRYKLHNEIDDCIVCDKCAKICPVDCIDIESIKSEEVIGYTSDGTAKRLYAAKFDIDMAKCCFCGLCTTVCPTECLTMTPEYDFSEYDVFEHIFKFGNMSPEQIKEKKEAEALTLKKKEDALALKKATASKATSEETSTVEKKPYRPRVKPKVKPVKDKEIKEGVDKKDGRGGVAEKPKFRPRPRPIRKKTEDGVEPISGNDEKPDTKKAKSTKPRPKPVMKKKVEEEKLGEANEQKPNPLKKRPRPLMKKKEENSGESDNDSSTSEGQKKVYRPRPKPVMRKPKSGDEDGS